ncbi:uncharacterized protein LOC144130123 isoform X1 [Amblyomma americanum]
MQIQHLYQRWLGTSFPRQLRDRGPGSPSSPCWCSWCWSSSPQSSSCSASSRSRKRTSPPSLRPTTRRRAWLPSGPDLHARGTVDAYARIQSHLVSVKHCVKKSSLHPWSRARLQ